MSEIRRGLIDYGGDELWTMTPLLGMSHAYDELTDDGVPKNTPDVEVVDDETCDENPTLNAEARDEVLADIKTDAEREARKKGRFVHFAGKVYPFDKKPARDPDGRSSRGGSSTRGSTRASPRRAAAGCCSWRSRPTTS
jgi:hypothetical protein